MTRKAVPAGMIRTADMKRRGWSEFLIGLLLGWPDAITEQNYSGRLGQTRWYQRRRVIAAEATADFKRGAQPCRPQLYKKPKRPKPGEDRQRATASEATSRAVELAAGTRHARPIASS